MGTTKPTRQFKKHMGKRDDLGIFVRSIWEANFARYLKYLQEHGSIKSWAYKAEEFSFPVKRGTRFYKPDFRVTNNDDSIEYFEVKGYMDAKSAAQLKRMALYHPDKKVTVVGEEFFRGLRRQGYHRVISYWE